MSKQRLLNKKRIIFIFEIIIFWIILIAYGTIVLSNYTDRKLRDQMQNDETRIGHYQLCSQTLEDGTKVVIEYDNKTEWFYHVRSHNYTYKTTSTDGTSKTSKIDKETRAYAGMWGYECEEYVKRISEDIIYIQWIGALSLDNGNTFIPMEDVNDKAFKLLDVDPKEDNYSQVMLYTEEIDGKFKILIRLNIYITKVGSQEYFYYIVIENDQYSVELISDQVQGKKCMPDKYNPEVFVKQNENKFEYYAAANLKANKAGFVSVKNDINCDKFKEEIASGYTVFSYQEKEDRHKFIYLYSASDRADGFSDKKFQDSINKERYTNSIITSIENIDGKFNFKYRFGDIERIDDLELTMILDGETLYCKDPAACQNLGIPTEFSVFDD